MMNLHILSDPVSDFWKCPKKGFKKSYLWRFLVQHFSARHAPPSPGITHEAYVAISCSSLWRWLRKSSSLRGNSWLQMFEVGDLWRSTNCTVLYCTVVNYPVFMSHHNYFLGKAHLKNNTHIWVVVDIDQVIMIVVTKRQKDKKDKKTKI